MSPLTTNPYIYGADDPASNWDPDGMCPRPSVCGPDQRQNERNYKRQEHLTFDYYAKKNAHLTPGYEAPYVAGVQHELPTVGSVLSLGRDVVAELSGLNDALRCLQGDKTSCAMLAIAIGPGKFLKGFRLADEASDATQTLRAIDTPHGLASQGTSRTAMAARAEVESGTTLWRIGTAGRSAAGEGQFWSLEHPLTPGYSSRYGVPPRNIIDADFIESAVLRPGSPFITRAAPRFGPNLGGGIEVVVPERGIWLRGFSYFGPRGAM